MANSPVLSDQEMLARLLHKVSKVKVPLPNTIKLDIPIVDVYGDKELFEIFNHYPDDEEIYLFTKLKKNHNGHYVRACGNGRWTATWEYTIKDNHDNEIGREKGFTYRSQNRRVGDDHGKHYFWKEYTLGNRFEICVEDDSQDYVICMVIKSDASEASRVRNSSHNVQTFLDRIMQANTVDAL